MSTASTASRSAPISPAEVVAGIRAATFADDGEARAIKRILEVLVERPEHERETILALAAGIVTADSFDRGAKFVRLAIGL